FCRKHDLSVALRASSRASGSFWWGARCRDDDRVGRNGGGGLYGRAALRYVPELHAVVRVGGEIPRSGTRGARRIFSPSYLQIFCAIALGRPHRRSSISDVANPFLPNHEVIGSSVRGGHPSAPFDPNSVHFPQ